MRVILLAGLLALAGHSTRAETGFLDRSVVIGREVYRYQIYVPGDYDPSVAYPVIVDLHGNGLQGSDGLRHTSLGLATRIREDRSRFPCIVVFPQARENTLWLLPEMEALVIAELDRIMSEFRIDPGRVYLTGFSMGATGAYRIAFRWPNRFAALVVIAGRVEPAEGYGPALIAIDRQVNTFVAAAEPFAALANQIRHVPISIFHGDVDEAVPVEQSRKLVPALEKTGAVVHYKEYPGTDHIGAAEKAYADTEMLRWLLSQRRMP